MSRSSARTPARDLASAGMLALGACATVASGEFLAVADALALQALAPLGVLAWFLDLRAAVGDGPRVRGLRRGASALALAFLASAPSDGSLESGGELIVAAISEHAARQGSLPASLSELDVRNPRTRYGRWRYERAADGADFKLSFGDYGRDTFAIELTRDGAAHWDR